MSYWVWAAWLVFLIVSFAIMEGWALKTGKPTLSASVWTWSAHFPLLPFICGLLAGGLAVHFFWEGAYCWVGAPILK